MGRLNMRILHQLIRIKDLKHLILSQDNNRVHKVLFFFLLFQSNFMTIKNIPSLLVNCEFLFKKYRLSTGQNSFPK